MTLQNLFQSRTNYLVITLIKKTFLRKLNFTLDIKVTETCYIKYKSYRNMLSISGFPIVGGAWERGGCPGCPPPPSQKFFLNPPPFHQNQCPLPGTPPPPPPPPRLRMKPPPLKHETSFHEMIPRKSTVCEEVHF